MAASELHELLQKLGFTGYEARAYITLVVNGPLTATELASRSEIPQPRIYDVVQSLAEKGMILVSEGRPRRFAAIDPEVALRGYLERRRAEEESVLGLLLAELRSVERPAAEPGVWTAAGYSAALNMLEESLASAGDELLFSGYSEVVENLAAKVVGKDVSTCVVLYDAPEGGFAWLQRFDEVRVKPTRAPVVVIPDFSHALVVVGWETKKPLAYKLTDENLVSIIAVYFLNFIRAGSKILLNRLGELDHRRYVHLTRALDHIREAKARGRRVLVTVRGRWTRDRSPAELSGEVVEEFENSYRSIGYVKLRLEDGREVTVGGIGAYLEDVEARRLEIKIL